MTAQLLSAASRASLVGEPSIQNPGEALLPHDGELAPDFEVDPWLPQAAKRKARDENEWAAALTKLSCEV